MGPQSSVVPITAGCFGGRSASALVNQPPLDQGAGHPTRRAQVFGVLLDGGNRGDVGTHHSSFVDDQPRPSVRDLALTGIAVDGHSQLAENRLQFFE